ncbi:hypothetical protein DRJ17_06910 [Candidatus Woesearchaeota archaeon]|nr:MAG: hypothetical protein DRJ17_06910 [Candidatus Woesearchaeota archaeon]
MVTPSEYSDSGDLLNTQEQILPSRTSLKQWLGYREIAVYASPRQLLSIIVGTLESLGYVCKPSEGYLEDRAAFDVHWVKGGVLGEKTIPHTSVEEPVIKSKKGKLYAVAIWLFLSLVSAIINVWIGFVLFLILGLLIYYLTRSREESLEEKLTICVLIEGEARRVEVKRKVAGREVTEHGVMGDMVVSVAGNSLYGTAVNTLKLDLAEVYQVAEKIGAV